MQDIKARVDEFKKMAAFANQLEDAGDDRRARAVRIALYDRVVETEGMIRTKIAERFGDEDGMNRAASAGGNDAMMKEAAINLGNLWKGIKGLGKGLWRAISKGEMAPGTAQALEKRMPGVARHLVNGPAGGMGILDAQGVARKLTPLGRNLAIGVPVAGLGGAAALAGHGRGPEQRPGEGLRSMGGEGYPGRPATLPPSGMPPIGGGGYGGPMGGGGMPPMGGEGYGGPMGGGGYGGPMGGGAAEAMPAIEGIQSKLWGIQSKLAEFEGRIQRLETGGG